jgi:hypothetical protein
MFRLFQKKKPIFYFSSYSSSSWLNIYVEKLILFFSSKYFCPKWWASWGQEAEESDDCGQRRADQQARTLTVGGRARLHQRRQIRCNRETKLKLPI